MREIARGMFPGGRGRGTAADYFALNGGSPAAVPPAPARLGPEGLVGDAIRVRFRAGISYLLLSSGRPNGRQGRWPSSLRTRAWPPCSRIPRWPGLSRTGYRLAIDPRGLGELAGLNWFSTCLGQAPAFGMGWDIVRAVAALGGNADRLAVFGRGPVSGQPHWRPR